MDEESAPVELDFDELEPNSETLYLDLVGGSHHQEVAVRVFLYIHGRISRQRRPSRCISIRLSSGPFEPGS